MKNLQETTYKSADWVGTFTPGSDAWHKIRSESIGGSEIGTLCGLNPWESAYTLWAKKSKRIAESDLSANWSVRLGVAFESPILDLFAEEHPELEIYECGTYRHKTIPYLQANPDAVAYDRKLDRFYLIEIKTARATWEDAPVHYQAQVQHYMDVMQIHNAYLVAVAGMNYVEIPMFADPFQQSAQRDAARRFWESLQKDIAPDWDGSASTYETVRELHPDIDNEDVLIDGSHHLPLLQERFEEAESNLRQAKSEIMALMGRAKHAYVEVDGTQIRVASRQARGTGRPFLVIKKAK